ncbi:MULTISPECIES: YjcZ family sporulation protein [Alkalihalophilus]|uniref:Toxic peptide n=2 Tax=Alkalihalophilus pseudofirmus TaxID=79885 RepID=D3FVE2_ALKPO|nr:MULTISPECIES: YjcZ family sporulation protein [Alkalihalophilus]ADC50343.1 putative toxic peptide [Alkalihalophilus pseudofirmus OF4]MCM3489419.1 YjcZ family sporulation protein [Alkalihalophilus marmarensis]MDV2886890.1 YjcZ family sporulation protein [Alkalihalophilus pseudofirmus]MEC2072065.1 YjcZ family sporulation protein [Alkalihalophilus marmarensis]MED1600623.1 YjcZ family sporulation protein [Alkalihalophilus marmarensis]
MSKKGPVQGGYDYGYGDNGFCLLVILFILLIIVGSTFYCC